MSPAQQQKFWQRRTLEQARKMRGLTQGKVAERMGINQANVCRLEGQVNMKLATLVAYGAAIGAKTAVAFTFDDGTPGMFIRMPLDTSTPDTSRQRNRRKAMELFRAQELVDDE